MRPAHTLRRPFADLCTDLLLVISLLGPAPNLFSAETDWPRFRGPSGDGTVSTSLIQDWSTDKGVLWKTALPGPGTSSPVIWKGRVYLTCHTGYGLSTSDPGEMTALRRHVLCLDAANGRELWRRDVESKLPEEPYQNRMHWHGYASNTPVVDDAGVYVFFGKSGLHAFSHDGQPLWQTSVGETVHGWGSGASLALHGNNLFVNACVEDESLLAFDKRTGKKTWGLDGLKESWNTPLVVTAPSGDPVLVVAGFGQFWGVHPDTGQRLWEVPGIEYYIVPSVLAQDGVLYLTGGRSRATMAVALSTTKTTDTPRVLWRVNKGSNVTSPVLAQGLLFMAHESSGVAYAFDAKTGDLRYEERLTPSPGEIYASPILAGDLIYYVSRMNGTYIVRASPSFELVRHIPRLDRSTFNASPAVSGPRLYLRSDEALYCLGER